MLVFLKYNSKKKWKKKVENENFGKVEFFWFSKVSKKSFYFFFRGGSFLCDSKFFTWIFLEFFVEFLTKNGCF